MQDENQKFSSVFTVQRTLTKISKLLQVGSNINLYQEMISSPISNSFVQSMLEISISSQINFEYRQLSLIIIEKIIRKHFANEEKLGQRDCDRKNDFVVIQNIRNQILSVGLKIRQRRLLNLVAGIIVLFMTHQSKKDLLKCLDKKLQQSKQNKYLYICVYGQLVDYYSQRISQSGNLVSIYKNIVRKILKIIGQSDKNKEQLEDIELCMKIITKGMSKRILSQIKDSIQDIFYTVFETIGLMIPTNQSNTGQQQSKSKGNENKIICYSFQVIQKLYEWVKRQNQSFVFQRFNNIQQLVLTLASKLLTMNKGLQIVVYEAICKCLCSIAEYDKYSHNLLNLNSINLLSLILSFYFVKGSQIRGQLYDQIFMEQTIFYRQGLIKLFSVLLAGARAYQIKMEIIKALLGSQFSTNLQNTQLAMYIVGQFPQFFNFQQWPQIKDIIIIILSLQIQENKNLLIILKLRAVKILQNNSLQLQPNQISEIFNYLAKQIQYTGKILNLQRQEHASILLLILSYLQLCVCFLSIGPALINEFDSKRKILTYVLSLIQLSLSFEQNIKTDLKSSSRMKVLLEQKQIVQLLLKFMQNMSDIQVSAILEQVIEVTFGVYVSSIRELKQNLNCKVHINHNSLLSLQNFDQKICEVKLHELCIKILDFLILRIKQMINGADTIVSGSQKDLDIIWAFFTRFISKQLSEIVVITEEPIEGYFYIINQIIVVFLKLFGRFSGLVTFSQKTALVYPQLMQNIEICKKILLQIIKFNQSQRPQCKQIVEFEMDQQFGFEDESIMGEQQVQSNLIKKDKRQIYMFINGSTTLCGTVLSLIHSVLLIYQYRISQKDEKNFKQIFNIWDLLFQNKGQFYEHYCFRERRIIMSIIRVLMWNRMISMSNLQSYLYIKEAETTKNEDLSYRTTKFIVDQSINLIQTNIHQINSHAYSEVKEILKILDKLIKQVSFQKTDEESDQQIALLQNVYRLQSMNQKQKRQKGLKQFSASIVSPEELTTLQVQQKNLFISNSQWRQHQQERLGKIIGILNCLS